MANLPPQIDTGRAPMFQENSARTTARRYTDSLILQQQALNQQYRTGDYLTRRRLESVFQAPSQPDTILPPRPEPLTPASGSTPTPTPPRTSAVSRGRDIVRRLTESGFFGSPPSGGSASPSGRATTPSSNAPGTATPGSSAVPRRGLDLPGLRNLGRQLRGPLGFGLQLGGEAAAAGAMLGDAFTPPTPPSIPALQRLSDQLRQSLPSQNPPPYEREYSDFPVYYVSGTITASSTGGTGEEFVVNVGMEVHGPISTAPGLIKESVGEGLTRFSLLITAHKQTAFSRSAEPVVENLATNFGQTNKPITVSLSFLGLLGPSAPPTAEPFNPIAPDAPGNPQPARNPRETEEPPQRRVAPPSLQPPIGDPSTPQQPRSPEQPGSPQRPAQPQRPIEPGVIPPGIPLIRPVGGAPSGVPNPPGPTPRFPFPGGGATGSTTGRASSSAVNSSYRTSSSTAPAAGPITGINPCSGASSSPCQARLDRTTRDTNDRIRDLQDRLAQAGDVANAAANAAILAKLDVINAKLGPQIPGGGIANFIKKLWDSQMVAKILNILTFVTVLHNAYMLSNNITQTLFSAFDTVLEFFGADLKNAEGQDISTSQWVGDAVEGFFNNIFGTETVNGIQANWKKFNRIYQAASNILSSFQSIMYSALESMEVIGNYVAQIGNAAKRFGVFADNCYRWMNPNNNFTTNRYFNALNNVQEAAETIDEVAGEALSIQQTGAELFNQKEALTKAVAEVIPGDTAGKPSNTTDTPQHQPSDTFETKLVQESQKVLIPIPDSAEIRQEPPDE